MSERPTAPAAEDRLPVLLSDEEQPDHSLSDDRYVDARAVVGRDLVVTVRHRSSHGSYAVAETAAGGRLGLLALTRYANEPALIAALLSAACDTAARLYPEHL